MGSVAAIGDRWKDNVVAGNCYSHILPFADDPVMTVDDLVAYFVVVVVVDCIADNNSCGLILFEFEVVGGG